MTDSVEKMRALVQWLKDAPTSVYTFTADGQATVCHPRYLLASDRDAIIALFEREIAALSASGTKSDGETVRVKPLRWIRTEVFGRIKWRGWGAFGEAGSYTDDIMLTPEEIQTKRADIQADYERQILSAIEAPGPSDPIPSQPDEREAIARIICCGGPCKMHDQKNCDALYFFGDNAAAILAILAVQAERRAFEVSGKYNGIIKWSDEDQAFIPEFPGCMSDVTTRTELADAQEAWLGACLAAGNKVPEPQKLNETSQPAPIAGLEPVQETWFSDRALPVLAMSGDVENDRALKLHFRRPVTDADRRDLTDALNLHIQHSRGQLYTRAQLEAHAAEQVRPLVEALEGLIEAVELDADEGLEGIGSYTGARLTDAKNAIRARGQV